MGHGRCAMVVQGLIVVGLDVAAGKDLFQMTEELRVNGHDILKVAMLGAVFHHQDLAVALDDLRLDLAHLLVEQHFVGQLAIDDLLADLGYALGAKRIGAARPAKRRLFFLIGLQQRLLRPLGCERGIGADAVHSFKNRPRALGKNRYRSLGIFDGSGHEVS